MTRGSFFSNVCRKHIIGLKGGLIWLSASDPKNCVLAMKGMEVVSHRACRPVSLGH